MQESSGHGESGTDAHLEGPAAFAYRALLEHTQLCEQCVVDSRECATGRVLVRTLREARRVS
ncbi:hypothetical protein HMPREF1211_04031 [Streptomyces sp. HGB0020]|nr:hypothetical protein HMPREF1211_04031 [Streptomyces sp. HGB0020]